MAGCRLADGPRSDITRLEIKQYAQHDVSARVIESLAMKAWVPFSKVRQELLQPGRWQKSNIKISQTCI
jgi:hypothetical protein